MFRPLDKKINTRTISSVILKPYMLLLVLGLILNSCKKNDVNNDPALNGFIANLKSEHPSCTCEPYLNQYNWRNQTVYVLAYRGPACDWFPTYYNKNLVRFDMATGYTFDKFLQEGQFVNTVWTC